MLVIDSALDSLITLGGSILALLIILGVFYLIVKSSGK